MVSVAGCFAVLPFFGLLVTLVLVLVLVLPLSSWDSRAAKLCDHAVSWVRAVMSSCALLDGTWREGVFLTGTLAGRGGLSCGLELVPVCLGAVSSS